MRKVAQNIWSIRKRFLIIMGFATVYLLGTYVVIPGVNPNSLTGLVWQTSNGLMGLLDLFSGGAFSSASIFALGIMPYILAVVIMRLMSMLIPFFRKMRYEDEDGLKKINRITLFLTVVILTVQGFAYMTNLMVMVDTPLPSGWWFIASSITIMAAGSMFLLWIAERITDKGFGNGVLFIIVLGIINHLPKMLFKAYETSIGGLNLLNIFLIEVLALFLVVTVTILIVHKVAAFTRNGSSEI